MKFFNSYIIGAIGLLVSINTVAAESKSIDISDIISKEEFSLYKNVAEFIEHSPKVTVTVKPEPEDISEYGKDVVKSITGSDCDRDGKMDNNAKCNAVYYKLWMKYER